VRALAGGLGSSSGASAVIIYGSGNFVQYSTFHDIAGAGVAVNQGTGNLVQRNSFWNIGYGGAYGAAFVAQSSAFGNNTFQFNTVRYTGRASATPSAPGTQILYNDLSFPMQLTSDGGCVYSYGVNGTASPGARTRIAYNHVHDSNTSPQTQAIYMDNYDSNYLVDHNVIWNFPAPERGILLNSPSEGHTIAHNTLIACIGYNVTTYNQYPVLTHSRALPP
jgi:hypothetical protein